MALSSAVVTPNRSFWTGAKVAFPAPVAAPDPEFPELDEQPVVSAVSAVNAATAVSAASVPRLATLALVPGLADVASRLARRSLPESKRRGEVWSFGRRGEVGLVLARSRSFSLILARSDRFMFPVTKD
jgi:hypothetical protein